MQEERRIRPPLTLLLGPAGAGKTEWALQQLCNNRDSTLLIVTSSQQADTRAEQAAELAGMPFAEARSAILTFYGLVNELLRHDREGDWAFAGHAFQRMVLQEIFLNTVRMDNYLGKMLSAPGFVPAFQERLREWKLAGVTPDALEAGADAARERATLSFAAKLDELSRLYRAYETFLHDNRLRDEEDGLLRAAHLVRTGKVPVPVEARLIVADGFFRLTHAQRDLLAALAERGVDAAKPEVQIAITLPYEESRPLLFAAPARTLASLRAEFETKETLLASGSDISPDQRGAEEDPIWSKRRPAILTRLSASLFAGSAGLLDGEASQDNHHTNFTERLNLDNSADPELANLTHRRISPNALQIFDAPNPYVEAEMTAREFRRLHDTLGIPWNDFAIILRTLGDYAPILSAVFERYGIPLGVDGPERLSENPLLKTVLHLLAVVGSGWQREDVLAFLKSSYTAPNKLAADRLRKRAQAKGVREGKDRWLNFVFTERQGSQVSTVSESLASTLRKMAHFDDLLTGQSAETHRFVEIVREAVDAFGLEERLLTGERKRLECDKAALQEAWNTLETLARLAVLRQRGLITFPQFHAVLREAWENASATASCEGEQVRVSEPYDARDRPVRVAAVMGLTERVFPRRIIEDPFLRDEERRFLADEIELHLEEQRGRSDDERFLFYLAVTAPSERLLLTFPRSTREADTLPSFYLDEVRAVVGLRSESEEVSDTDGVESGSVSLQSVSRTLADVAPRWEDAVSPDDRLLAACADLFDAGSEGVEIPAETRLERAAQRMQLCLEDEELRDWSRTVLVSRRLPSLPRLSEKAIQTDFVAQKQVYSAAELETFAKCPFQYLLRYVFKLRAEIEGLDHGLQSALMHSILRRYFRKRAQSEKQNAESGAEAEMQAELCGLLNAALESSDMDASPHYLRMVQRRLTDDLDGFARREMRFSQQFPMTPAHFHLAFGMETRVIPPDPFSCAEPLMLQAGDGGRAVAICGTIDRVDLDTTGQRALILDYELGRPPEFTAIQKGESLQMPLHLLAMERLFGKIGAAACYDSMRETGRRRFHRAEHVNIRQFQPLVPLDDPANVKPLSREQYEEITKTAEAAAVRTVRAIEEARVDATPGEHCKTCSYRDVCRTSLAEGHDGE